MGRIRTSEIKTASANLIRRFPDKFSPNFERNKELVDEFNIVESKRMRNQLAGYITRSIRKLKKPLPNTL